MAEIYATAGQNNRAAASRETIRNFFSTMFRNIPANPTNYVRLNAARDVIGAYRSGGLAGRYLRAAQARRNGGNL